MSAETRTSATDLGSAIAELCDKLVPDRLDQDAVDLTALAKHLGVVDVLYKASRIHGYTLWAERGPTLFLAMAKTEGRRRATLAHECAHLILNPAFQPDDAMDAASVARALKHLGPNFGRFERAVATLGIERVCDRLAFELLFPRQRAREAEFASAEELREMASRLRVSLALVVNEAHKAGVPVSLLRLTQAWDRSWIVVDTAGAPARWNVGSRCDDATNEALTELEIGWQSTQLPLRREGSGLSHSYSVMRHRSGAIAVRC